MLLLRDYQKEAVNALYAWFQMNETGNPLLVLPTGSGKSLIQAKVCEDALCWPNQRILCLTHVRELIEQNHQQLMKLWPEAPAGIYCAGLDRKQAHHPITFASIQSVHKKANLINWRDLVIIDEAHLLGDSDSGMYRSFLTQMLGINPNMKVIGMSATPYRLKSGYLHTGDNALFSDIAFNLPVLRLVKEGYLSPLINKAAITQGDTDKLGLQSGEFAIREAITEFDRKAMTDSAVEEMLSYGHDRKTWLVFCVSIEHAEHVRDALRAKHVDAEMVCDKTPAGERARILADLKAGRIRAITNVSVLTTGFDAPNIDMIVLLRPTMSPGLLVQMCGRGMRLAPNKENCLILDMAANLERHGPITHILPYEGKRKEKKERDGKMCQHCRTVNPFTATECIDCGKPFPTLERKIKHTMKASMADAMSDAPVLSQVPSWLTVNHVNYEIHKKTGSPDSVKVLYNCKPHYIMEWLCFAHPKDFPKRAAANWWMSRHGKMPVPATAEEAMRRMLEVAGIRTKRIRVVIRDSFKQVVGADLVRAETILINTGGNLNQRITQVEENHVQPT